MTRDALMARWSEIGEKLVRLAGAFPEDKFEFRAAPGVRSFAEQLRHVAFWNQYLVQTMQGKAADGEANELPRHTYPTKPTIVAVLKQSFDGVTAQLARAGTSPDLSDQESVVGFIEHNREHYGQLVVYCRLNGLVPPTSQASESS